MTMLPRARRLHGEHQDMRELTKCSSMITFTCDGVPPMTYRVALTCGGLARQGDRIVPVSHHEFDLELSDAFPLQPPKIVWRTPVFHPNFRAPVVCTGDIWFPGHSLAELCVELCELVQYKTFNIYDPLDPDAASWLAAQLAADKMLIPVDPTPIRDAEVTVRVESHDPEGTAPDGG